MALIINEDFEHLSFIDVNEKCVTGLFRPDVSDEIQYFNEQEFVVIDYGKCVFTIKDTTIVYYTSPVDPDIEKCDFEAKAMYTGDIANLFNKPVHDFPKREKEAIFSDIDRLKSINIESVSEKYFLLFLTHYHKREVPRTFMYNNVHKTGITNFSNPKELKDYSSNTLRNYFTNKNYVVKVGISNLGRISDISIEVITIIVSI